MRTRAAVTGDTESHCATESRHDHMPGGDRVVSAAGGLRLQGQGCGGVGCARGGVAVCPGWAVLPVFTSCGDTGVLQEPRPCGDPPPLMIEDLRGQPRASSWGMCWHRLSMPPPRPLRQNVYVSLRTRREALPPPPPRTGHVAGCGREHGVARARTGPRVPSARAARGALASCAVVAALWQDVRPRDFWL